jgi:class 3 adenylate cyclase
VIERAGDIFGLPINVAHIVTKSARPGMLLATAEAGAQLPSARRGRYRTAPLTHPTLGETRVTTVRRAGPATG